MKKIENKTHIEGFLYDHKLSEKVSGPNAKNPGKKFISGTIHIEVKPGNVVAVNFRYVGEPDAGTKNENYTILKNIIDGKSKTVLSSSLEEAEMLKVDSSIGVNDFYDIEQDVINSNQKNDSGFIHTINKLNDDISKRGTFSADVVITKVKEIEADEEKGIEQHLQLKCATFNYRKDLIPCTFSVFDEGAIQYFLGLDLEKEPVFTKLWGEQESQVFTKKRVEESAFGDDQVVESEYNRKYWTVTGARKEAYVWDSEDSITKAELDDAVAARATTLAEVKKNRLDYEATKKSAPAKETSSAPTKKIATNDYQF